jgi:hypothetical protein
MTSDDFKPIFIDIEAYCNMREGISTDQCRTYKEFCQKSHLRSISIAFGWNPPQVFLRGSVSDQMHESLLIGAADPTYLFVTHNAPYDISCLHYFLGIPIPRSIFCTLEASRHLWPHIDHALGKLAVRLRFPTDLRKGTKTAGADGEELAEYNKQDVRVLRHLYSAELDKIRDHAFARILEAMQSLEWKSLRTKENLVPSHRVGRIVTTGTYEYDDTASSSFDSRNDGWEEFE